MKCAYCDEKAVFHVTSASYEEGKRKNVGGRLCPACLLEHLSSLNNAHHFIYRLDASYQPDGSNYDDGLIMSVLACAKHRSKSVEEFMARGEQLLGWYGEEAL